MKGDLETKRTTILSMCYTSIEWAEHDSQYAVKADYERVFQEINGIYNPLITILYQN
jgi:hypothetical protein